MTATPDGESTETSGPPAAASGLPGSLRGRRSGLRRALNELDAIDRAVYLAVADARSPTLDARLARLSNAANNSGLWFALAAGLTVFGRRPRRAALLGVAAIGAASASVNLVVKPVLSRERPDRHGAAVVQSRHVRMPTSASFPSGHAASAFAFVSALSEELPVTAVPLRLVATAVAYSRVHTGVHYPGDVVIGGVIGAVCGATVRQAARALRRRRRGRGRG